MDRTASPDPKLPGAFPASPGEPDHVYETAKSYVLNLSEKTKPYLPQVVAKHLPESHHEPDRAPEPDSKQIGSISEGPPPPPPPEEEVKTQPATPVSSHKPDDDDDDKFVQDITAPGNPDSVCQPKDNNIGCEQQERVKENLTEPEPIVLVPPPPPILISNRHLSGSDENLDELCGASSCDLHSAHGVATAPTVVTGAAEDRLLANYLSPPGLTGEEEKDREEQPVPESGKQDAPETPSQFEPQIRDYAVHPEELSIDPVEQPGKKAMDDSSQPQPYKPHPLENIQEKTRDNRLPPIPPPSSPPPTSSDPAGSGILSKLKRGRRRSSGADSEGQKRPSVDATGSGEMGPLAGIQETTTGPQDEKRQGMEQTPKKVGLMDKIKGEIKVVTGELQRNKEKVEAGKRMKEGL